MSTSNFKSQYLELWRDGGTIGVELPMPDKKAAVALRHRLYRLRTAMKAESHPWSDAAELAAISIMFSPDAKDWTSYSSDRQLGGVDEKHLKWKMVIQPPDSRFDEILESAGYKGNEPPPLE